MKRMLKNAALLLTAVMIIGLLSGCMDTATQIMIGDNGRTTFVQATYLAEKVITDYGKTPEEVYKTQIDEGGTLGSLECNGNTYWGIVPTPQFYETFDEFCEAMQQSSSTLVSAYKDPEYGYETIIFDIPAVSKVAEENGQNADQDPSGYAELLVFTANLQIAGRWYGIDMTGKGKDLVKAELEEEDHVLNLTMPCTDEEYQVKVWGSSSPEKDEEYKMISSVSMDLDSPRAGLTPSDLDCGFTTGGEGSIKRVEKKWFDMDSNEVIGDMQPFEAGNAYGVQFTVHAKDGSAFADDFTAYINGEPAITFVDDNDPKERTFGYIFGRLPGGDPNGIKTVSVRVAEPKAGAKPQAPGEVKLDDMVFLDEANPEGYKLRWLWLVSENEGRDPDDWVPMEKAGIETFEEGHYYALYIDIPLGKAKVSYELTGKVNGKDCNQWAMSLRGSKKEALTFFHNFGMLGGKALTTPFNDVPGGAYYEDAVAWAYNAEPQITDGNGKDKFMPDKTCTRGQVVTFLWRAAGCPEPKSDKCPFTDVKKDDYFYKPVLWAVEKGITEGTTPTTFSPEKTCTNAHILTFLYRAVGAGDDGWYQEALNWAKSKGILGGSYSSGYDVKADCPRSNVVYYLYNYSRL